MQHPEANTGNYKVDAEALLALFEHFNRKIPFGFQLDWSDAVQGVDWCVHNSESVEVKSQFPNCYLLFRHATQGDVVGSVVWNKNIIADRIVVRTFVGDFLRAVDGIEEDDDEQ